MDYVTKLVDQHLVSPDWIAFSDAFGLTEDIFKAIQKEKFYPELHNVFRAFNECPIKNVKVVILGQD